MATKIFGLMVAFVLIVHENDERKGFTHIFIEVTQDDWLHQQISPF